MGYYYNMIGYVEITHEEAQKFLKDVGDWQVEEISDYRKSTGYEEIHYSDYMDVWVWKEQGKWNIGVSLCTLKDSEAVNLQGLNKDIEHALKTLNEYGIRERPFASSQLLIKYASQEGLFVAP